MKKLIPAIILMFSVFVLPAQALFLEGGTTLIISNLEGIASNQQVALTWDCSPDENGGNAASFKVYSATQSVAEGITDTYENTYETTENSLTVPDLENGTPLYFAVQAIGQNTEEGPMSEEIRLVPSLGEGVNPSAPTVVSAEALNKVSVLVEFSEDIDLPSENPELSFSIYEEDNDSNFLLVWSAAYYLENEGTDQEKENLSKVVLITDEQEENLTYMVTVSAMITDTSGNPIESGVTDSATFIGTESFNLGSDFEEVVEDPAVVAPPELDNEPIDDIDIISEEGDFEAEEVVIEDEPIVEAEDPVAEEHESAPEGEIDTTPPAEVSNFVADFQARTNDFLIRLSWSLSADAANEIVEQILYHSLDQGNSWDVGKLLIQDSNAYEMAAQAETEHTFKLTTRDSSGNESAGVIRSVRLPELPDTGPLVLGIMGIGLISASVVHWRRKK